MSRRRTGRKRPQPSVLLQASREHFTAGYWTQDYRADQIREGRERMKAETRLQQAWKGTQHG